MKRIQGEALTVGAALQAGAQRLAGAGCDEPRLDAEVLLADLLGVDRAWLYAHPERPLSRQEGEAWHGRLARRARREPTAYILGRKEFYGLDFLVDRRVLVPRPETELIVERVLALATRQPVRTVWDAGTGSGALALTLAYRLPQARVVAGDLSREALQVAALNRRRLGLEGRVQLVRSDLLGATGGPLDVVVANLPYLRTDEYRCAMPEVSQHEPRLALDGGPTGLELVARLLAQAAALDSQPRAILLEIGAEQGCGALALAREYFPACPASLHRDLAGLDRVLEIAGVRPLSPALIAARAQASDPPSARPSPCEGEGDGRARHPLPGWERGQGAEGPVLLPAGEPASVAIAAEALRRGDVVAFPTDTVYGLGAAVFQPAAVQALYEIKGRPEGKAIPLLLANGSDLPQVAATMPPAAARLVHAFWPGPLTLVLEARAEVPAVVRAGGHTVAVRVPDHPVAQSLIRAVGAPLATTSANRSGGPEALTASEVVEQLGARVRWVIDGGRSPGGRPSTVVDLTVHPPAIRRLGAIPAEVLLPLLSE